MKVHRHGNLLTIPEGEIKKEDIGQFYHEYAELWDKRFPESKATRHFLIHRLKVLQRLTGLTGKERVLDIGCGTGYHLAALAKDFTHGAGLDIAEGMIEYSQKKYQQLVEQGKLDFLVDDAETLSKIEDESIDVVYFTGLIEHLLDPTLCLKNCLRVLKPGGALVGLMPNQYSPWYSVIRPILRKSSKDLPSDTFYTPKTLAPLLKQAGYTDLTFEFWGFIPAISVPDIITTLLIPIETLLEHLPLKMFSGGLAFKAIK